MKFAAAMKYGGELIAAMECNYDSFKELVPLCPECKEPVFLRAGGDRFSVKGKPYKVASHWSHFKGRSAEDVATCEIRVNNYSESDKQRIAAQARGQRSKLIQRWFWKVFSSNRLTDYESMAFKINRSDLMMKDPALSSTLTPVLLFFHQTLGYAVSNPDIADAYSINIVSEQDYAPQSPFSPLLSPQSQAHLRQYDRRRTEVYDGYGYKLHRKIFLEVMQFLGSPRSRSLFCDCIEVFATSFYDCTLRLPEAYPDRKVFLAILSADWDSVTREFVQAHASRFFDYFWFIPWAKEFERLENERKAS